MAAIRVLLMLDKLAMQGMRQMLAAYEDVDVVGEAAGAVQAVDQATTLSPDVVLVDADLPHTSGFETARMLQERDYPGAVVVLSTDARLLEDAVQVGARGYLLKDVADDELLSVIRRAPEGGFVFGASVMDTPEGMAAALGHITSRRGGAAGEELGSTPGTDIEVEAREGQINEVPDSPAIGSATVSPSRIAHFDDTVLNNVELRILPPVNLGLVLKLQQWLNDVAHVDMREMGGSPTQDTVFKFQMRQRLPLVRMLAELPYVAELIEEEHEEDEATPAGMTSIAELLDPGTARTFLTRFRLVLKAG